MQDIFWYIYFEKSLYVLLIQFFLFLFLVFLNFRSIANEFSKVNRRTLILAVVISLLGSILLMVSGYQMGGGDWFELIVAKEFSKGVTGYYTSEYYYGPTSPLLTSMVFFILGVNPVYLNFLNFLMMALIPFLIFLIFYSIFSDENFALLTSVISLIILINQTAYWNEFFYVTIFFISLALLFSFLSFRINKKGMYLLALVSFLLVGQIKLEHMILILAFFFGLFIFRMNDLTSLTKIFRFLKNKFLVPLSIFLLLSGTYIAKYYHVWRTWYLDDAFQLGHLEVSSKGFLYFWATPPNIYLTILFIFGLIYAFIFKKYRREISFILSFFVLHNLPYLLHYNGYQEAYGILTYTPYVLISGFGVYSLAGIPAGKLQSRIIFTILMVIFLSFYALLLTAGGPFVFENAYDKFYRFSLNDCELEIARNIEGGDKTLVILQDAEGCGPEYKWSFLTLCKTRPLCYLIMDSDVYRKNIEIIRDRHPDIFSASKYFYDEAYLEELENLNKEVYEKTVEEIYNMSKSGNIGNPLNISFGEGEVFYIQVGPENKVSVFKEFYNLTRIYECDGYALYKFV